MQDPHCFHPHVKSTSDENSIIVLADNQNFRDFPTFLKSGAGACCIWEKSFRTIKIGKTRTGWTF